MYLQLLATMEIHQWLTSTIKSPPVPGPDTTLAELDSLGGSLSEAVSDIRETQARIGRLSAFVRSPDSEDALQHSRLVDAYLESTIKAIGRISQSISTHDPREVSRTLSRVVPRLEKQAGEVAEGTDDLFRC